MSDGRWQNRCFHICHLPSHIRTPIFTGLLWTLVDAPDDVHRDEREDHCSGECSESPGQYAAQAVIRFLTLFNVLRLHAYRLPSTANPRPVTRYYSRDAGYRTQMADGRSRMETAVFHSCRLPFDIASVPGAADVRLPGDACHARAEIRQDVAARYCAAENSADRPKAPGGGIAREVRARRGRFRSSLRLRGASGRRKRVAPYAGVTRIPARDGRWLPRSRGARRRAAVARNRRRRESVDGVRRRAGANALVAGRPAGRLRCANRSSLVGRSLPTGRTERPVRSRAEPRWRQDLLCAFSTT
jgi:hypothetical protein